MHAGVSPSVRVSLPPLPFTSVVAKGMARVRPYRTSCGVYFGHVCARVCACVDHVEKRIRSPHVTENAPTPPLPPSTTAPSYTCSLDTHATRTLIWVLRTKLLRGAHHGRVHARVRVRVAGCAMRCGHFRVEGGGESRKINCNVSSLSHAARTHSPTTQCALVLHKKCHESVIHACPGAEVSAETFRKQADVSDSTCITTFLVCIPFPFTSCATSPPPPPHTPLRSPTPLPAAADGDVPRALARMRVCGCSCTHVHVLANDCVRTLSFLGE